MINEWTVITVIVTIVGLIITVATPVIKLYSAITALSSQVDQLLSNLDEFKVRYKEQLHDLNETDQKLFSRVNDHEHRISKLEAYNEKGGNQNGLQKGY